MKTTHTLLLIAGLCLAGCGTLVPTERAEKSSVKAVDTIATHQNLTFEKTIEADRLPNLPAPAPVAAPVTVTSSGTNNTVRVTVEAQPQPEMVSSDAPPAQAKPAYKAVVKTTSGAVQKAGSNSDIVTSLENSIPGGVKLLLLAAGIIAVTLALSFAIKAAKNNSAAAAAALRAGDALAKRSIDRLTEMAMTATDPAEVAKIQAKLVAAVEERGKFNAGKLT